MTPDKDYGQLVTDRVFMYRPALKGQGFEVRGPEQVCERYGISSPRQVIDLLALEGDASDNVPGCPGVGEKTAAKLIAQFGSVENLLDNTDSLKGALQKKIIDNAAQILMSKSLVTINTSAPVDVRPDNLIRKEPDVNALLEIYRELEFKSFIQKWEANTGSPAQEERPERKKESAQPSLFDFADEQEREVEDSARPQNVTILTSELTDAAAITCFVSKAIASGTVGIAVNSVGQEAMTAESYGIALAYGNKELHSAYIPYPAEPSARAEVMTLLEPLFAAPEVTITGADIKRDMLLLRRDKVEFAGARWFDIGVAHYLCSPESRHNTASLASVYLGIDTYDAAESPSAKRKAPADPA
ncbi:MAG: DNA polymerase I, partial [Muribaculaceae bacterium]|nr:DNA polymerase I [Muribaculaceae bacterium]